MSLEKKKLLAFFSALADNTRLSIVLFLRDKSACVKEIHKHLGEDIISLSGVSHQLKLLYNLDIVVFQKKGKEKIFDLSPNFCWCMLEDGLNHFDNKKKSKQWSCNMRNK